jgi:hypothetical protein
MPAGNIVRENLLFNKSAVSIKDDTAGNSVTEAGWNANNPGDLRNDQILLPNDEGGGCFSPNGSEEIDLSPITFAGVWDAAHRWNGSSDIIMEPGPYWNSLIGIT